MCPPVRQPWSNGATKRTRTHARPQAITGHMAFARRHLPSPALLQSPALAPTATTVSMSMYRYVGYQTVSGIRQKHCRRQAPHLPAAAQDSPSPAPAQAALPCRWCRCQHAAPQSRLPNRSVPSPCLTVPYLPSKFTTSVQLSLPRCHHSCVEAQLAHIHHPTSPVRARGPSQLSTSASCLLPSHASSISPSTPTGAPCSTANHPAHTTHARATASGNRLFPC